MSGEPGPKIVVTEAFSPRHLGNWALAECGVQQIRSAFPNARLTVLARDPEGIEQITGERTIEKLFPGMPHYTGRLRQIFWLIPNALWMLAGSLALIISRGNPGVYAALARAFTPRGPRRDALDAILEADLVVSISGESINEKFLKKLPFVLYTYWLPARLGKPVALFPQSYGPLRSPIWKKMTAAVLRRCAVVMPRDEESLRFLLDIGLSPERCPLVPDMAIGQRAIGEQEAGALLRRLGLAEDGGIRIAVVPSVFQGSDGGHIECLAGAVRMFLHRRPEAQVAVLIGNRRGGICGCRDYDVAEQFIEFLGGDRRIIPLLDSDLSPAEIKGICRYFDLVITCRMHMAILSTMGGAPTIALATQPKIREYMRICDQEDCVVSLKDGLSSEELFGAMEKTLKSASEIRRRLAAAHERLRPLAAATSMHARQALSSHRRARHI